MMKALYECDPNLPVLEFCDFWIAELERHGQGGDVTGMSFAFGMLVGITTMSMDHEVNHDQLQDIQDRAMKIVARYMEEKLPN
jgi:hypothetical protein